MGQDGVHLIAQALDVPLYRRTITGSALELKSEYGSRVYQSEMSGILGDETEDMYQLLCEVKVCTKTHPSPRLDVFLQFIFSRVSYFFSSYSTQT